MQLAKFSWLMYKGAKKKIIAQLAPFSRVIYISTKQLNFTGDF